MFNQTKKTNHVSSHKNFLSSRIAGKLISALLIASPIVFTQSVAASPSRTKVVAQMTCTGVAGLPVIYPEYYSRTRSGLDIWICVETGSGRQAFLMVNPGPYAVIVCNMLECQVVDWTY